MVELPGSANLSAQEVVRDLLALGLEGRSEPVFDLGDGLPSDLRIPTFQSCGPGIKRGALAEKPPKRVGNEEGTTSRAP